MSKGLRSIVLLFTVGFCYVADAADSVFDDAQWDLGIGAGGFQHQLYPGSRAKDSFVIPVPYLTFRSPLLEIDRGIKGFLHSSDTLVLDISADFALPVDSSDSGVRQGMPDLNAVLQLGPSVAFRLGDIDDAIDSRFEIPLRLALASDLSHTDNLGWLLEPRLSVEFRRDGRYGISYKFTGGLLYASDDFHAYYYDVAAGFATAQRPSYVSEGGYGGAFVSLRTSYRFDDWAAWLYLRLSDLTHSEIEDSPLVETTHHYFIGVGFAWIIASNL